MSGLSSYLFSTLSKVGSIASSGLPDFPFTIGPEIPEYTAQSIWELHEGHSNSSKEEVSIFIFSKSRGSSYTAVALNALKRARTLRHPGMLRYLGGTETADSIYIATEHVEPLIIQLSAEYSAELKRWGLHKIAQTLQFINNDCKMIHTNVSASTVFVTKAGEWKLGGLELADSPSGTDQAYRKYTSVIPGYSGRMAPELQNQSWDAIERGKQGAADGWSLACLIQEMYNGPVTSASQMGSRGEIPQNLWALCQRLSGPDLRRRMTAAEFLEAAHRPGGFLDSDLVRTSEFLETIAVKDAHEKAEFLSSLGPMIEGFPETFSKFKILPELLKLMEFGGGDAKVLSSIIEIGKALDEAEYNELVTPAIVQLFGSNDRALRFSLLEHISSFIGAIPAGVVSKQVLPNFTAGFGDAAPAIREATVKASLAIAPKLSQKSLNADLVRQLVRLIGDPEPGIRTNALICIGKLGSKPTAATLDGDGVTESSYRFIVCPAIIQAFRDPFPPVRAAALTVASACAARLDPVDVARRVVPSVSPLAVDTELPVRTAALKALTTMVARIEVHAHSMPETVAKKKPEGLNEVEAAASMASGSDSWGGWAVSSLSSTLGGALSLASSLPTAAAAVTSAQRSQSETAIAAVPEPEITHSVSDQQSPALFNDSISSPPADDDEPAGDGWGFDDDEDDDDAFSLEPQRAHKDDASIASRLGLKPANTTANKTRPSFGEIEKDTLHSTPGSAQPHSTESGWGSGWDDDDWGKPSAAPHKPAASRAVSQQLLKKKPTSATVMKRKGLGAMKLTK